MTRLAALVLLLPLAACGAGEDEKTLTVLAAASLTGSFTDLADAFEAEHEGVEVRLVLGSSTALAEQAVDGAPGDVLATADEQSMRVAGEVTAAAPQPFARNSLTLVTPPGNPAGVESVADLDSPAVDFVTCAVTAPCGALAEALLEVAGVNAAPASQEVDVKGVLGRVTQGEADAGLVYRTDAVAAGDEVTEVAAPEADELATTYLIAPLQSATGERADLAADFVAHVRSPKGQQLLADAGFGTVVPQ